MRAGWVHDLKIYCYTAEEKQWFVVMGKVSFYLASEVRKYDLVQR